MDQHVGNGMRLLVGMADANNGLGIETGLVVTVSNVTMILVCVWLAERKKEHGNSK